MHHYLTSGQIPTGQRNILIYADGADERLRESIGWRLMRQSVQEDDHATLQLRLSEQEHAVKCTKMAETIVGASLNPDCENNPVWNLGNYMFHHVGHPDRDVRRWQPLPLGFREVTQSAGRIMDKAVASLVDWSDESIVDISRKCTAERWDPRGWMIRRHNLLTGVTNEQPVVRAHVGHFGDALSLITLSACEVSISTTVVDASSSRHYAFVIGPEGYTNEVVTGKMYGGRYLGVSSIIGCDVGNLARAVQCELDTRVSVAQSAAERQMIAA